MKRFLLLLGFLACCLPVHADLIKQGAAYTRTVKMYATGSASGLAGATLTITASYNGAAPVSITPTVTTVGNGVYALSLTSAQSAAIGALDMYITAAGADPTDTHDQVYSAIDANAISLSGQPVTTTGGVTFPNGTLPAVNANGSVNANLTTIAGAGNTVTATGGVTFTPGTVSTYAGGNVTVGGYAANQDPATLVFGKSLETGATTITFADFCRIVGAYAGGNSDGSSLYRALGDTTKTRITVTINATTKARTVTLTTTP